MHANNQQRFEVAQWTVEHYCQLKERSDGFYDEPQGVISDLISDILHYAYESHQLKPDEIVVRSIRQADEEIGSMSEEPNLPCLNDEIGEYLFDAINASDALVVGDSPLLSAVDCGGEDGESFYFNWEDSDGEFSETLPFETLYLSECVGPGRWMVMNNEREKVIVIIYKLKPFGLP